jgi:hypothetical protein
VDKSIIYLDKMAIIWYLTCHPSVSTVIRQ